MPDIEQTESSDTGYTPPATQADLDRIIADRVARVKAKPPADYAELQSKAARLDEIEAANKSELEKAQSMIAELTKRAETAESERRVEIIGRAVVSEASRQGAVDPDAVLALLDRDAVTIDDAGRVTGAETAVKALLEAKPYLKAVAGEEGHHEPRHPLLDLGQGARGAPPALNSDDLVKTVERAVGLRT